MSRTSFSVPRALARASLVWVCALVASSAQAGAPEAYPRFEYTQARPSLVVTQLLETGELPHFDVCLGDQVMCLDPPPTWMRLRRLATVYGEPMPETFHASTTSHYGPLKDEAPRLMLLQSHDGATVMPRYASARLSADSKESLHLVLLDAGPRWLPCLPVELRAPLVDPMLAQSTAVSLKDYRAWNADQGDEYFRIEGEFAYPRYSIPLARLQAHLAGQALSAADFSCPREAGVEQ